jgi:hypothetical protein
LARTVKLNNANEWTLTSSRTDQRRGDSGDTRRGAAPSPPPFPPEFLAPSVTVERILDVTPTPARRAAGVPMIDLSVAPDGNERYVLAIRHPSGALTFHGAETEMERRAARRGTSVYRFHVPLRSVRGGDERRGIVTKAIKAVLLKVAGRIADAMLPALAARAEAALWRKFGLSEGLFKLDEASLRAGQLKPGGPTKAGPAGRVLLFLHGTFSHAASAYKNLTDTNFFAQIKPLYGDQIFAFNHFTVSKSPEDNARQLLAGLPDQSLTFDVVTHSRGGLVLRNLVERASVLGPATSRFNVHHAVLVASPNDGTPLASPERWENTVGWFANLLEVFPENPLTFAAGFVAEGIVWIAKRAAGGLPGIAAMDSAGEMIADLQGPPGPAVSAYSALVSNYAPDESLVSRMLDVGIDAFFGSANDLVVPSEGGWRIDRVPASPAMPSNRIGCFGLGGNFPNDLPPVHHLNFFGRVETATFLVRALNG